MRYSILLVILNFSWQLFAQQIRFDRFDVSNGLSQNNINCLERDDFGNIWVGTLDGINVFNGHTFNNFRNDKKQQGQLEGNHITAVGRGLKGCMWVITRTGGLNFFDAEFEKYSQIESKAFEPFNVRQTALLKQVNDSLIWLSDNARLGVWLKNENKFLTYPAKSRIYGIIPDAHGNVVIYGAFGIDRIQVIKTDSISVLKAKRLNNTPCFGMAENALGIVAATKHGIVNLNNNYTFVRNVLQFTENELEQWNVSDLNAFEITDNRFWLGGNGFLICYTTEGDKTSFHRFEHDPSHNYSFKGHTVTHFLRDNIGNLWIGTAKNGLFLFNNTKNQFRHYDWNTEPLTDPQSNPIRAICKTQNKQLWIGFDREGVGVLTNIKYLKYYSHYFDAKNNSRPIKNVRTLFEDSKGTIWIGALDNLCIYNPQKDRIESVDCHFDWNWPFFCYCIKEFEPGIVTLSSPAKIGFLNLSDKKLKTISIVVENSISGLNIRDMVQDNDKNLWLALNDNGLLKLKYPTYEAIYEIDKNNQLTDKKVYTIIVNNDSLWVGTNRGLNLFSSNQTALVKTYFETDGLCNNVIYNITKDSSGNLWMSTNRGISYFNLKTEQFTTYLANDYFMDDAHFIDHDGTIFYGGYTGVVSFHPSKIKNHIPELKPLITGLFINNEKAFPCDSADSNAVLKRSVNQTDQIVLPYHQNTFSLSFNAYPFDYPNTNTYKYRLKNFQNEWIEVTGSQIAAFTKVPPGNYLFQLIASPNRSAKGNSVELEVLMLPPFWMTRGFKIIFLVLLLAILVLAYKLRLKNIEKRTKYVKQKVEELSAELIDREKNSKDIHEGKDLVDKMDSMSYPRTKLKEALIPWGNKMKPIEGQFTTRDIEFINQVNLFIDENLHDSTFSIELLSKKVNMSRATFYRKFTELTNMKPADYIKHIRLKKAFQLLEHEDYTVAQAAECVGFQSESHFRKSFKLEFGITPSSIKG